MPDSDAHKIEDALTAIRIVERALGLEEGRLLTPFMDGLTLADRLEPWDMITPFIDGVELPEPEIGYVEGLDHGLFYRGFCNMVWGEDGHGKSLLIDQVTWVERHRGHKVMILEAEELSPLTRVARWLDESNDRQLVTAEDVAGVIVYPVSRTISADNVQMMATQIRNEDVSVVFIDSLGALMASLGLNENEATDVYKVKAAVIDPLTEAGAGVVIIDHVTKSEGAKSRSIGSGRKRHILSGVAFELRADDSRWSRKRAGHADLTCWKDRQGRFTNDEHVATLWVTPSAIAGYLQLEVEEPREELVGDQPAENRQYSAPVSVDEQLDIVAGEMLQDIAVTAKYVRTVLRLEFKKDAQALLDVGVESGRFMYDRARQGYVLTSHMYQSGNN